MAYYKRYINFRGWLVVVGGIAIYIAVVAFG
jgi:hypothetical protein